jgi:hypothetical protein
MTNRCSAAVPAAVRRASAPAAPMASRHRESRQDAGATVGTYPKCGADTPVREKLRSNGDVCLKETAQ